MAHILSCENAKRKKNIVKQTIRSVTSIVLENIQFYLERPQK